MGIARLLAKSWTVFCLFCAGHALHAAMLAGTAPAQAVWSAGISALLFTAMGLLFIAGYAAAGDHALSVLRDLRGARFLPSFDDAAFVLFVALSFAAQSFPAPGLTNHPAAHALRAAVRFAVPGQRALESVCGLAGGQLLAAAFAWLLAIVYAASAVSRVRLTAALLRFERARRAELLSPVATAAVLGVVAIAGFQMLFVGTAFRLIPCSAYDHIFGAVLIGLAPLLLAYAVVAAAANLIAVSHE
ncbi:MAG: hypothetical protein JOZ13_13610 [Alphaproteobacteria bacterium]|nr:hypothetical protein [Alphaproteobacteria bacterium]